MLQPGRGKTKTGRLWVYVRDDRPISSAPPAARYQYTPDRKGEHPERHLKKYRGILQADAYGGWGKLYASGQITEAACWAHARRPWWDLYLSSGKRWRPPPPHKRWVVSLIWYAIERDIRGQPPDVRQVERQARAGPLLQEMHAWLSQLVGRVSAKSELAKAIGYSLIALAGPDAVLPRWAHRDGQQRSRAGIARGGFGTGQITCSWDRMPAASERRRSTALVQTAKPQRD